MSRKSKISSRSDNDSGGKTKAPRSGHCHSSPAGRSRRRLLRAMGGSGVALGAVLASDWREPVVKAVVLPAHGQMSPAAASEAGINLVARTNWFETEPDISTSICGSSAIRMQIELLNASGMALSFDATPADTFQRWSTPNVLDSGVTVDASPAGSTVAADATFVYDIRVAYFTLPGTETGLAFRPVSNTLGTMDPDTTPLASASIECAG